jgi:hypothetical protein
MDPSCSTLARKDELETLSGCSLVSCNKGCNFQNNGASEFVCSGCQYVDMYFVRMQWDVRLAVFGVDFSASLPAPVFG